VNKINFHTHSSYCDGQHNLEQIVEKALELGMYRLGFSGHGYTDFDESYCMSRENTLQYRQEIAYLKEKYADRIELLCGIEQDYYGEEANADYDYIIGSVHYVEQNGIYIPVDESATLLKKQIQHHFGGDYMAFAEKYFSLVSDVALKTKANIIGHFDLLTKFNEEETLFDERDVRYQTAAEKAMEKLAQQNVIVEINTGAMARGYRTKPYPNEWLFSIMKKYQVPVIINSDCHDKEALLYGFDTAYGLAEKYGLRVVEQLL